MVAIFTGAGAGFQRGSANILGGAGQLGTSSLGRATEGVSVNAATGNLLISQQDEFLVGLGPDAGISRTYNSLQDAADGDNGDNWQQSTTRRLFGLTGTLGSAGSTINRLSADGSVITYEWDAAASFYVTSQGAGAFDTLTENAGVWTWTDGDSQVTETYEAHGSDNWRITARADQDGNTLTFTYSGDKLDKVTTADGGWTQYVWTGSNITEIVTGYTDLATSTAETLTRVRYAYDGSGRLASVTTDLSPDDSSVADGETYAVSYTYDGASNRVASIAQSDGSLLAITYDGSGRVETLTQTVASGVTRVTTLTYGTNYTQVTAPDGTLSRLDYDTAGQLTKITAPPAVSVATPQETSFAYDGDGNVISVTDGNGNVTQYDHDANGNVILVTDANGNTAERSYDSANRLITELTYGLDEGGVSAAQYMQYAYDSEGHLRFAVDAAGHVMEHEYTAAGQLLRTIRYPEHAYSVGPAAISEAGMESWVGGLADLSSVQITQNSYDARGGVISTTSYGAADASGAPLTSEGVTTSYNIFDQAGRLLERHAEGQASETFVYDGMGRLVASTDVHGGTTTIVFDDANTTTTVTTALGYSTVSTFNKAGELISTSDSGARTAGGTSTYAYDPSGQLRIVSDASTRTSYIHYDDAGRNVADVNHLGEITEYRYDAGNRVIATVSYATPLSAAALAILADPNNTAELSSLLPAASASDIWSWNVYDDGGRLIQAIDNLGSTVAYEYDASERLVRTTAYANQLGGTQLDGFKIEPPAAQVLPASDTADAVTRSFYNEAGQLVAVLDGEGYLTETIYDAAGQAVQSIAYATPTLQADRASGSLATLRDHVDTSSVADRTSHSVYDGQGLLRFCVNALGGVTGYEYDAAGNLIKSTVFAAQIDPSDYTYDAVKVAISADSADRTSWTVRDSAGRAAFTVAADGGVTGFTYDAEGRVTKSIAFANLYDTATEPTLGTISSWADGSPQANDAENRVSRSFYSERGELLYSVDPLGYVTGFTYDAEGRVLAQTAYGGSGVTVNDATTIGGLESLLGGIVGTITTTTTYDAAGRVATTSDGEGFVTRKVYDALGQLVEVHRADGTAGEVTTRYSYDGAGRVVEQVSAFGSADAITAQFAYDGLGNQVSTTDPNGNVTNYAYDRLGQLRTVTDARSGVTSYSYDTFGNVVKVTDARGKSSYSYYDLLNRLIATRDAEGYVTRTSYNRFGEVTSTDRFTDPVAGAGETGLVYFNEEDLPPEASTPLDYANYLQTLADAADAQATNAEADAAQAATDAAAAAQAAADADADVADIEAQLVAAGGGDLTALSAQLVTAQAAAVAAHQAADAAEAIAAPLRPQANQLRNDADAAQAAADALYAQAAAAAADATLAAADVAAAAQAITDANAVVAAIEAQITALGGDGSVSLQSERSAALADMDAWLSGREDWLRDAENDVNQQLVRNANGDEEDELESIRYALFRERNVARDLEQLSNSSSNLTKKAAYINHVFDQFTWEAFNFGGDRTAALANPSAWLADRKAQLENWIDGFIVLDGIGGSSDFDNTYDEMQESWVRVVGALYDLDNGTYSTGWPDGWGWGNEIRDLYNDLKADPTDLPNLNHTTQHASDYRAGLAINAYFDVLDEIGEFVNSPLVVLGTQLAVAEADVDAAEAAEASAQAALSAANAAASQLAADADQAQDDADGFHALVTQFLNANPSVAAADVAAQAAADADATVASLEAQIEAILDPGAVDFETERAAALADMDTWLDDREDWLDAAQQAVQQNVLSGTNGAEENELRALRDALDHEKIVARDFGNLSSSSSNLAKKAAYINFVFDQLTWDANNLANVRSSALANRADWLADRRTSLENWIDGLIVLDGIGGSGRIDNTYEEMQESWITVTAGIYDLDNSTYSTGWPSNNGIGELYDDLQVDPNDLPNLNPTSQHAADYRANLSINAYFDVLDEVGTPLPYSTVSPLQSLMDELGLAQADAVQAHCQAGQAQTAANAAQALAVQLRVEADQAQDAADDALAYAQGGSAPVNRDNFVLLDAADLGDSATTYFSYDKLGRTTQKVDAEGFVETYAYDAFDQLTALSRYSTSVYELDGSGTHPDVVAAYNVASSLQTQANNLAADAAAAHALAQTRQEAADDLADAIPPLQSIVNTEQSQVNSLASQLANHPVADVFDDPLQYLQAYRAEVVQEVSYWQSVASSTSTSDPMYYEYWALYDFYVDLRNSVDAEIASVQANNPLSSQGEQWVMEGANLTQTQINSYNSLLNSYNNALDDLDEAQDDLSAAQTAANNAQTLASNTLADAQDLDDQAADKQTDANQALADAQALEAYYESLEADGLPEFETSELGAQAESAFEYDNRGQLIQSTDAAGFYETYAYDGYGRQTSVTAKSFTDAIAAGGTTLYSYDKRGLLVSETLPIQAQNSNGVDQGAIVNRYEYDERGNLIRKIEADGLSEARTTEYAYDDLDRLIAKTSDARATYDADTHQLASASFHAVAAMEYDANGNVTRRVNADGSTVLYFYDELDRKTVEIDEVGFYTAHEYDENGNVVSTKAYETALTAAQKGTAGGSDTAAPSAPSGTYRETTFAYDDLNRLSSSSVNPVLSGEWSGTSWVSSTSALVTQYEYDQFGNVVRVVDPNGNATFSYYDMLGRKVAQLDSGSYLTKWTYDSEGNVLSETRYANRFGGTPTVDHVPLITDSADDRVTSYQYDLVGNRTSEARSNVKVHNGSGGTNTVTSTIEYTYNGLGQVLTKEEATGDLIEYEYDAGGRLASETRPEFANFNGQTVSPQLDYSYDGIGNLVRMAEGKSGDLRVTRYAYDQSGLLTSMTDAAGNTHTYFYDDAGNRVIDQYQRTNSSGATSTEAVLRRYDALGQVTYQVIATKNGGNWTKGDVANIEYGAFGQVLRSGTNGLWQQENKYDDAGRLIASNAGDGLWKHFGYDKNGNQTITIANGGVNLAGKTFNQALAMVGQTKVIATFVEYDARNLAVEIVEEDREISTTSTIDLTTSRTYNAFGEVTSETDALGYTTDFKYNTMGRLIEKKSPQVEVVSESGVSSTQRPTEKFYYDASGRMVAQRDANGNVTKMTLLAGTGYGGGEALVTQVTQPGNATVTTGFDVHGDARKITDQIGRVTTQSFDDMGRLEQVSRPGGVTEHYAYDELGQQIKHWNSVLGSGEKELTDYDRQGRIVASRAYGGEVTTTSYQWSTGSSTNAIGNFGGWITSVQKDGQNQVTAADLFGRQVDSDFTYDAAGRLIQDDTDPNVAGQINYQYYNTGKLKYKQETDFVTREIEYGLYLDTSAKEAWFSYDEMGRLRTEKLTTSKIENFYFDPGTGDPTDAGWASPDLGQTYQESVATYDAMGRLIRVTDDYGDLDKSWKYDANGNVRKIETEYRMFTGRDTFSSSLTNLVEWYRYDALNRVTLSKGDLVSGSIVRGADGIEMTYDAAGQRKTSQTGAASKEHYTYNDLGLVTQVHIGSPTGTARVSSSYDGLGRLNGQIERDAGGNVVFERFDIQYNARNQVLREKSRVHQDTGDWIYNHTVNHYNDTGYSSSGSDPALISGSNSTGSSSGDLLYFSRTKSWVNGSVVGGTGTPGYGSSADNSLTDAVSKYYYDWHETKGYLQSSTVTTNQFGTGSTSHEYDGAGNIVDADRTLGAYGGANNYRYATDAYGQVIEREEYNDTEPFTEYYLPRTHTYRFGGREIGIVSNDGTENVDYATLIGHRDDTGSGTYRYGSATPTVYADFDSNHVTMAGGAQEETPGIYTAVGGENLQTVAQAVWGDAGLWYRLAEVNGLSAGTQLNAGQRLVIPNGVAGIHHNAGTIKPYDPNGALGDISPPHAAPPKPANDNGCGAFGKILVAAIGIAVTVIAPINGGWLAQIGNGLLGNVASQGIGLATGVQDSFNFKSLALTGVASGVSVGLNEAGLFGGTTGSAFEAGKLGIQSGTVDAALSSIASGAISQGIGVATGLQSKFSWAGVAAAGVAGGVGRFTAARTSSLGEIGGGVASNSAALIASAATRSAIEGSSFGDNFVAGLPDVIGQAVGRALANSSSSSRAPENLIPDAFYDTPDQTLRAQLGANPSARKSVPAGLSIAEKLAFADSPIDPSESVANLQSIETGRLRRSFTPETGSTTIATGATASEVHLFNDEMQAPISAYVAGAREGRYDLTVSGLAQAIIDGTIAGGYDANLAPATNLGALIDWISAGNEAPRGTISITRETSALESDLGNAAMHPAGTAVYHIFPSPIDTKNTLEILANENPTAAKIGTYAPLALSVGSLTARGTAAVAPRVISRLAPTSAGHTIGTHEFVGPLIGRSGFRTTSEFADAVGVRYQKYVDEAFVIAERAEANGLLTGLRNTRVGKEMDLISSRRLRAYLRSEGIPEGPNSLVQMNRWLRDPLGSGAYVRPDVHIPAAGRIFDATIAAKSYNSRQITRFGQYSNGDLITLVRPGQVGGSFSIVP